MKETLAFVSTQMKAIDHDFYVVLFVILHKVDPPTVLNLCVKFM